VPCPSWPRRYATPPRRPHRPEPLLLTLTSLLQAYEEHCRKNGKPADHAKAVELMAGFAGGAIDKVSAAAEHVVADGGRTGMKLTSPVALAISRLPCS
jgi:hypothetical protein